MGKRQVKYWSFKGGLDFVTPPITIPEGRMISGRNFEPWIDGGYRRIAGYERFDGQPKPSDATWMRIDFLAALGEYSDGDPWLMNVPSMLNFAGMPDGTDITDFVVGNAWTAGGDAAILSGELIMDGTGDSLAHTHTAAMRDAFNGVSTDKWTIEYKAEIGQIAAAATHIDWRPASDARGILVSQATGALNKITVNIGDSTAGWDGTLVSTDTFIATDVVEVAITRNVDDYYLHIDGVYQTKATFATDLDLGDLGLLLGIDRDGSSNPFDGNWRRMRMTSGTARYAESTNYTPEIGNSYSELQAAGSQVGDTVSGVTSGATGLVISISLDLTKLYVTKVTGEFDADEDIKNDTTGATPIGTMDGAAISEGADTPAIEGYTRLLAENEYRIDIQQIPGINDVRGIWQIKDRIYAFRDNTGETAGIIHKATASGWDTAPIEMAVYVYFTGGLVEPAIGDTLDGGTSAATGTIHKIVVHTGTWGTSDAAGYFVLTAVAGTYSDAENLQVSAATQAVASGASEIFAFPVGGRYDFISENYYASATTYRVYGVNGVGPGFEIDENDVVSPILLDLTLGDSPDENKPHLVEAFDGRLWMAFSGGSLQHSIVGDPITWNGFLGSAEYGLGDEITGLTATTGEVLVARTRRKTHGFYIDSGYVKKIISDRAGGLLHSEQELDTSYACDDSGMTSLQRVQAFGDFANATISDLIQPYMVARKELISGSMIVRESNQYRILYNNGEGVIARLVPGGKAEFGLISYPTTVYCAYSCEDENGTPNNWFGGASGYVYQAEIGRNFDGETIEASARLPFNHQGTPYARKRYRLLELELEAERDIELLMASDLSYSGLETGAYDWTDSVMGGGGLYDVGEWDRIYWDAQQFSTARFELTGTGKNISILIHHNSATTAPFILQGAQLHFDVRRTQR